VLRIHWLCCLPFIKHLKSASDAQAGEASPIKHQPWAPGQPFRRALLDVYDVERPDQIDPS
jgi:hypothetical protein